MMTGEPTIPDYHRSAIEKIKKEVKSKDDKCILGVNLNEYIEHIYNDYAIALAGGQPGEGRGRAFPYGTEPLQRVHPGCFRYY